VFLVAVDLCTTTSVRKAATELHKVKEMFDKVYMLVEKDNKKSDSSWLVLFLTVGLLH